MDAVISLGGSMIVPEGIDVGFLKEFRKTINGHVSSGNKTIIITGGGNTAKTYVDAGKQLGIKSDQDLDWIGIRATQLNAELVKAVFPGSVVIDDPTAQIPKNKVVVGAGWKPGASSDLDAVLVAVNLEIKTVINMTNIDFVYDRDPKQKGAKPMKKLSWKEYKKIISSQWTPRMNVPFDPVASREAEKHGIKVIVINGHNLQNLKKVLSGKEFAGSVIG